MRTRACVQGCTPAALSFILYEFRSNWVKKAALLLK
jgi:hypothetical protein